MAYRAAYRMPCRTVNLPSTAAFKPKFSSGSIRVSFLQRSLPAHSGLLFAPSRVHNIVFELDRKLSVPLFAAILRTYSPPNTTLSHRTIQYPAERPAE